MTAFSMWRKFVVYSAVWSVNLELRYTAKSLNRKSPITPPKMWTFYGDCQPWRETYTRDSKKHSLGQLHLFVYIISEPSTWSGVVRVPAPETTSSKKNFGLIYNSFHVWRCNSSYDHNLKNTTFSYPNNQLSEPEWYLSACGFVFCGGRKSHFPIHKHYYTHTMNCLQAIGAVITCRSPVLSTYLLPDCTCRLIIFHNDRAVTETRDWFPFRRLNPVFFASSRVAFPRLHVCANQTSNEC